MATTYSPFKKHELIPQTESLEIPVSKSSLHIGIPRETHFQERRVCLTPDAVSVLVANGHQVMVETAAGVGSNFSDTEYADAGAIISYNTKEVFQQHIILKIAPLSDEEIDYLVPGIVLISALQLITQQKKYFQKLAAKKITALSFDEITDEENNYPILKSLSEIAGTSAILIASELMSTTHQGTGLLMGGIAGVKPLEVVIIGAGTVGTNAAKAAIGLGASVRVFDLSVSKLRNLQNNLNQNIYTSTMDPKELHKSLMRCDVIIGAIRSKGRTDIVISEEMVTQMKPGSVIIDVSIDRGGCIETSEITTHNHPTFEKHGVIHYGVTNISSRVSRTASRALNNFFLQALLQMGNAGGIENFIIKEQGFKNGIYLYKGILTHRTISEWFSIPYKDINLLLF